MPYAVYSKRTGIVSRIVHELSSLLPSEAMIEVDDEISYPKSTERNILGQQINTCGYKLFDQGGGVSSTYPWKRLFDAEGRPYIVKFEPQFIKPVDPNTGEDKLARLDLPIFAHPFGWKADELARAKYDTLLAKNYPYQAVIGEEFLSLEDIDTAASDQFTLTEGKCVLSPSGSVTTNYFKLQTTNNVLSSQNDPEHYSTFVFDTLYFTSEPDFPEGVIVQWQGKDYPAGDEKALQALIEGDEIPTTLGTDATATFMQEIRIKITNLTTEAFEVENFMLFLRLRKMYA